MNPMDAQNDGIAGAVAHILDAGRWSGKVEVVKIPVTDTGRNGMVTIDVPIVIGTDRDGRTVVMPVLDHLKAGMAWLREQRLQNAAGPDRIRGTAVMQSLASFLEYIARFQDKDSAVFGDSVSRKIIGIIDYNRAVQRSETATAATQPGEPRWGSHRALYACPLSKAWEAWGGVAGKELDQDKLAALLDTRDMEIAAGVLMDGNPAPSPAKLLTFARNLEYRSGEAVKRTKDANGNARLEYTLDSSVITVDPPTAFLIQIPVFEDSQPLTLETRLRWTIKKGDGVQFTLAIRDAEGVLKRAFQDICAHVRDTLGLPVFVGTPEA